MTIEGAIAQVQNLIDNQLVPTWIKPSLREVKNTVKMELAQRAESLQERKTGKWVFVHPLQEDDAGAYVCSCCLTGSWEINPTTWKACPWCTALMEVEE